jgi:hypothetical protein
LPSTSSSIAATNRLKNPKKRRRPASCFMYSTAYRWIRKPTPVISSTKTAASGSKSNPKSTCRSPTAMKSQRDSSTERFSRPRRLRK